MVVTDEMTVWCPYGPKTTATIVDILKQEVKATFALLDVKTDDPLVVWIEEAERHGEGNTILIEGVPDPAKEQQGEGIIVQISDIANPTRDGNQGRAVTDGNMIMLYVPPRMEGGMVFFMHDPFRTAARHELAHVAFFRKGFSGNLCFVEGFAEYVRTMRLDEDGHLEPARLPSIELLEARDNMDRYPLPFLVGWSGDLDSREATLACYHLSQALVTFLLERREGVPLTDALGRIVRMSDKEVLSLENEWLAWLKSLNFAEAVTEGAASDDVTLRKASAHLLVCSAERGCAEILTPEMDELAVRLLHDPATAGSAVSFLIYYRYTELGAGVLNALLDSDDPFPFLTGQALLVRRGGKHDPPACREAFFRLSEAERKNVINFRKFLFPDGLPKPETSG
jgi:hypothetical protein